MTTNIISTQLLKDSLKLVLSGTGTAQALEGSDSLVVSGGAIHSFNGEISVSVPLVDIEGNPVTVTGCLKAKTLASYVAKLKGDTVEVEVSDTGAWTLRTAKGTVEPSTFNDPLSARLAELNLAGLKWEDLPGHFVSALALVRLDNGKLEQPYILFTKDAMLARDRFRYNAYDLREIVDGEITAPDIGTFALNSDYVKELLNCSDLVQIAHSGSYAHFLTESGVVLSIKKTDGSAYPEAGHRQYLGMLADFKLLCETDLPTDLAAAIDRASVFAQDDKVSGVSKIEVSIRPDRMELRTSRTEGKATETLSWPMPLPESTNIDMTMSGPFLKEAASRGIKLKVLLHELGSDAAGNDRGTRTVIVFQNTNFTQMVSTLA